MRPYILDLPLELSRCSLFAGLNSERLGALAKASTSHKADQGTCLIVQEEPVTHLYVIVTGEVRIYRNSLGKRTLLYEFRNYDYFGEFEIMGEFESISDADVCSENITYIAIEAEAFSHVALSSSVLAGRLMRDLCRRMKRRNEQFATLSTLRPAARLANSILLDLELYDQKEGGVFEVVLRPNAWAERIGASLRTVNYCFSEWRKAHAIQRIGEPSRCAYRVDREALMAIRGNAQDASEEAS